MILCHLTNTILIGADERTARVSVTGGVTSGASADHVLSYVAWVEDNYYIKVLLIVLHSNVPSKIDSQSAAEWTGIWIH